VQTAKTFLFKTDSQIIAKISVHPSTLLAKALSTEKKEIYM